MKKKIISAAFVGLLAASSLVHAEQSTSVVAKSHASNWWPLDAGVTVSVSTLGIGANVSYKINECFKVRGVANYFKVSRDFNKDEMKVKADLRLLTAGLLGDWHVVKNGFRLTAGAMYNGNRLDATSSVTRSFTIHGHTYTPADIGTIKASLTFRSMSPYLGLGYDSGHNTKEEGFSFTADVGVLFQGKARGKINSISGALAGQSQAINDTKDELTSKVNAQSFIKIYPVISLGVRYTF